MQSLAGSKTVEISPDQRHMRTRQDPGKWSLAGVEPTTFSTLDASVPEFVPGKMFLVPTTQSSASETQQPQTDGPATVDPAAEVSSRLEEVSISMATAAEPGISQDASRVAVVDNSDAAAEPDVTAGVGDKDDAAIERLNSPSDDQHRKR